MKISAIILALILASCAPSKEKDNGNADATEVVFSLEVTEIKDAEPSNAAAATSLGTARPTLARSLEESISDVVFYIFDQSGTLSRKLKFTGTTDYKASIKSGTYTVYALCNTGNSVNFDTTPGIQELEEATITAYDDDDNKPVFTGKKVIDISGAAAQKETITVNCINAIIRIKDDVSETIDIKQVSINNLPTKAYLFDTDKEVPQVKYDRSITSVCDSEGYAVFYCFMTPSTRMTDTDIFFWGALKNDESGNQTSSSFPLDFIDELAAGERFTASITYNDGIFELKPDNSGDDDSYEPEYFETVTVGNTEWMRYNLANPKQAYGGATFATRLPSQCTGILAKSHGKFYQWGVNVAWNSTGSVAMESTPSSSWNNQIYPFSWVDQPCPDGYRLPTQAEFQELIDNCTSTYTNYGSYGYITFVPKNSPSQSLEFPAIGKRSTEFGTLFSNNRGHYWSSSLHSDQTAYNIWFDDGLLTLDNSDLRYGYNVRCVKGEAGTDKPDMSKETVKMGATEWMRTNLSAPRQAVGGATFADKVPSQCSGVRLDSHGKLYQWGVNVGWGSTGLSPSGATPNGTWQTSSPSFADWSNHPCPDGYRLPTEAEFSALVNDCTTKLSGQWSSTDYGYITFILKADRAKNLEFPAVGRRDYDQYGKLTSEGQNGGYWSSNSTGTSAYSLSFSNGGPTVNNNMRKTNGLNIRCVKGYYIEDHETVEIDNVKWMKYNLANPKQAITGATFATKLPSELSGVRPASHGKFYQWGINAAWNSTGDATDVIPGGIWDTSINRHVWTDDPCPYGYRLPSDDEFESLVSNCNYRRDGSWTASNYGYMTFSLKTDASQKLEFPAIGTRGFGFGYLEDTGETGGYWCNKPSDNPKTAYFFMVSKEYSPSTRTKEKSSGLNVRCVKD